MPRSTKYALIKMIIIIAIISVGGSVIVLGYFIFLEKPVLVVHDNFSDDIKLNSNYAEFNINFDAQGGFYPNRGVGPFVQVTLHEEVINSSNIHVIFYDGRIIRDVERKQLSIYDDPVRLNFHDTTIQVGINMSRYIAEPFLIYDYSGKKGAEIRIDMHDGSEPYEREWLNVVEIKAPENYTIKKNEYEKLGFGLMILGIALIATAPTFSKVFEYYEEFKENKNHNP